MSPRTGSAPPPAPPRSAHPAAPPPAPPARVRTGYLALRAWCVVVLVLAFGGGAWVEAFGPLVAGALAAVSAVVTAVVWIAVRPDVQWRRLPWYALAYTAWAVASLIWSAWPATSALTLALLVVTTLQGLFVGAALGWHDLVATYAAALRWVVGLSLLFELAVAVLWGGPILPGFQRGDAAEAWSQGDLLDGSRPVQGIVGDSGALGAVALVAVVVFALRFADRPSGRIANGIWIGVAAFLWLRAGSATAYVAAAAVAVVLGTILAMRTTRRPGERTRWYALYVVVAGGGGVALWLLREPILGLLGRSADLAGLEQVWGAVAARAGERPGIGWGFATPWLPWDPAFAQWIAVDGRPVLQAHDMWLDALLQLGVVGVVLLAVTYLAFVWRAWFFAVDRPRWDLRADRPYSAITLLPSLVATVLLVQGITDSSPLLAWGWLSLVLFAGKIKQSPLVGVGPAEQRAAIERGDSPAAP